MANSNLGHGLFVRRGGKGSDDPSGTSPREARKALAGLFEVTGSALKPREGVLIGGNKNLLYGMRSGMQIGVRPFTMGLARQKDGADGLILMANTDVSLINIDPAPAAGSRIDVVYVAQNESESETTNSTPYFGVAKGVAGTPGTKPVVPQFAYELGYFTVSAGMTDLSTAVFTESWQYTALRGTPVPVRSADEMNALDKRAGLEVIRMDNGRRWRVQDWQWVPADAPWVVQPATTGGWSYDVRGAGMVVQYLADGKKLVTANNVYMRRTDPEFRQGTEWMHHGFFIPEPLRRGGDYSLYGPASVVTADGIHTAMYNINLEGGNIALRLGEGSTTIRPGDPVMFSASWTTW